MNLLLKYVIYPAAAVLALLILICAPIFVLTVAGIIFLLSLARSMYREDARRTAAITRVAANARANARF